MEEEWKFEEMYIPGTIVDQINNCKIIQKYFTWLPGLRRVVFLL